MKGQAHVVLRAKDIRIVQTVVVGVATHTA